MDPRPGQTNPQARCQRLGIKKWILPTRPGRCGLEKSPPRIGKDRVFWLGHPRGQRRRDRENRQAHERATRTVSQFHSSENPKTKKPDSTILRRARLTLFQANFVA